MSQKNSRLGAIGEHMAAAQLMLQGWDAFNANYCCPVKLPRA